MENDLPPIDEWLRECERDDLRRFEAFKALIVNKRILDFGCGPGGFLLMARFLASKVSGVELEKRLQSHFSRNGLQVFHELESAPDSLYDVITAFHVIEHLSDPVKILQRLAAKMTDGARLIIEVPSSDDALLTLYESQPFSEFTYWSCHKFLFNSATLRQLAVKAGLRIEAIQHVQRYPLSNHLYWLAKGKPGGHRQWFFLSDKDLEQTYTARLAAIGKTDTLVAILTA